MILLYSLLILVASGNAQQVAATDYTKKYLCVTQIEEVYWLAEDAGRHCFNPDGTIATLAGNFTVAHLHLDSLDRLLSSYLSYDDSSLSDEHLKLLLSATDKTDGKQNVEQTVRIFQNLTKEKASVLRVMVKAMRKSCEKLSPSSDSKPLPVIDNQEIKKCADFFACYYRKTKQFWAANIYEIN